MADMYNVGKLKKFLENFDNSEVVCIKCGQSNKRKYTPRLFRIVERLTENYCSCDNNN